MSNFRNPLFDWTNRNANSNRFTPQSSAFDPMANMPGFGVLSNLDDLNKGSTTSGSGGGVGAASGAGTQTSRANITPAAGGGQPAPATNPQNPNTYAASTAGTAPAARQVTIVDVQSANTIAGLINLSNSVDTMADSATKSHLQDIIKDKIYEMRRAEKLEANRNFKESQRNDWAEKRTRQEMQRDYPIWASWKRSNPDIDVGDDLSFQAFEKEMANPERARAFRGFQRLSSMKTNITNNGGLAGGRNAADAANTQQAGRAVDELLTNIAAPEKHWLDGETNLGRPSTIPEGGDQKMIGEGMRTDDMGTQQYALDELRKQKAANEAARKDPQYQADEKAYRNLQVTMMNMGLSADVQMRMNKDIEKGLITPQDAMRMIMMMQAGAKSRGQTLPQALPSADTLTRSRQANDLRRARNTTDTQPQRQTMPPGFPAQMAAESRSRAQTNEAGYQNNQGDYLDALARGEITPEQYRMLTGG